jgi:DNA-directed RNA polymerase specialized sigma24 family protein
MQLSGYSSACAREALEALSRVPDRRRQVKILSVAGFSYDDIGAMLGLSYTRVNALATEANKWLRTERRRDQSGDQSEAK